MVYKIQERRPQDAVIKDSRAMKASWGWRPEVKEPETGGVVILGIRV